MGIQYLVLVFLRQARVLLHVKVGAERDQGHADKDLRGYQQEPPSQLVHQHDGNCGATQFGNANYESTQT